MAGTNTITACAPAAGYQATGISNGGNSTTPATLCNFSTLTEPLKHAATRVVVQGQPGSAAPDSRSAPALFQLRLEVVEGMHQGFLYFFAFDNESFPALVTGRLDLVNFFLDGKR